MEGLVGEGVVSECDLVELSEDELDRVVWGQFLQQDGVGNSASEIVVDT